MRDGLRPSCIQDTKRRADMAGLITMGLLPGQSIEIAGIDAARRWNRTGLVIECGVTYRFEVTHVTGWRDGKVETDPDGY